MRIPLAKWQPDLSGLTNPGQNSAKNVIPRGTGGYAPLNALSEISTTGLDGTCYGAFSAQDSLGATNTFAGTAAKLYNFANLAFSDVSKSGGYTVASTERWRFEQWGQRVLATQIGDPLQYFDLASSTAFDDLAGTPPKARHIAVVRDFVVLGNTENSPNEVFWSGFNNSEQWTQGINQCDSQTLQGGGWINGLVGGEVGIIFQEHAITRMTYVGPPDLFQFDLMEQQRGLVAPGAKTTIGNVTFYRSQDGFYQFDPVNGSVSIGYDKVDNWFAAKLAPNTFPQISCGSDPVNKLVYFSFVSVDATDVSNPDTMLIYNYVAQEWAYAKISHEFLYPGLSEGVTLDSMDTLYSSLDAIPFSLDSRAWSGGDSYAAVFDTSHQLCNFGGTPLEATLETADFELTEGQRSLVTGVRPLCDTSAATAQIESRERFADATVSTSSASMETNGDIPLLSSGRYHRVSLDIPAGEAWTFATAVDVDAQPDGSM